jgi:hypothetical protein
MAQGRHKSPKVPSKYLQRTTRQVAKGPPEPMKRVKGVEDLNICIIGAQGIVGVGATIRMST